MTADVVLDGNWVNVEGKYTRLRTYDLMLDSPERRVSTSGWRRAMVHDRSDGLTINYGKDYPGGVTINGNTKMEVAQIAGPVTLQDVVARNVKCANISGADLDGDRVHVGKYRLAYSTVSAVVLGDSSMTDFAELEGPGLQIKGDLQVQQKARFFQTVQAPDVEIRPDRPHGNEGDDPRYDPFSLTKKLADMQREIEHLKKTVAELKARIGRG